jgi:hypothetical protein
MQQAQPSMPHQKEKKRKGNDEKELVVIII